MADISQPWVIDSPLNARFPVYTRANVGEVAPGVATPLMWSMIGGPPAERLWKQALADFGAFDLDEFRPDLIDIQGMLHGYIYLNLSNLRVFGARMPGASPELMDQTYLGEGTDVPPYEPHPDDDAPQYTERILQTVQKVFATESRADFEEDAGTALDLRASRPDYPMLSDGDLVALQRRVMNEVYPHFIYKHLLSVYESSLVTGLLDQTLAPLEDPTLAARLMGGLGNIASAAPTSALWQLSRIVAGSPALTETFDAGVDGLLDRLRAGGDPAATFLESWDAFIYEFGSRSTEEWAAMPQTWETHPHIPLGLIERMRLQPADRDPQRQSRRLRAEREHLTAGLRERLAGQPEQLGQVELALKLIGIYMPARELSKTNTIRVLHEARLPMRELALRYVAAGVFSAPEDITMLREDELNSLLDDPKSWVPIIAERWDWYRQLEQLDPPYIVKAGEVPPVTTWPKKKDPAVAVAQPGDILTGLPACPGFATGTARVINDPSEATDLQPGEILVAPMTDPGWTPLFTSAEAVVVNVGAALSHAAIVSRELGIPCVLGVTHATKRIPNGTRLSVDGTSGLVTVL
jgi:phosphohistidine swiveling domain-containing protein